MKKTDFILIGAVLVIIVIAVLSSKGMKGQVEIEFPLELTGEVGLNEITYDEYEEMVNNNKPFVVVIERTGCSYCQKYMPIMEEVANEKKVAITYINTDNLTSDEYTKLSTTNKYLKKNQWGTPTTLLMVGDEVVDTIGGYVEKDAILNFLDKKVKYGE